MSEARQEAELLRMVQETRKFVAEAHKPEAECRKLDPGERGSRGCNC